MYTKKEFKNYISEKIKSSDLQFVKAHAARIESMCRAVVNRSSYEFRCDDKQGQPSIYLIKDDKVIFIEKPNPFIGNGFGVPLYLSIYGEVLDILDDTKESFVPPVASEVDSQ